MVVRFGISDAATVATSRMFVGVSASIAAPTNVSPATMTNAIGIGHDAADSTMRIYYGGSVSQTPIDLGVNFPAKTLSTDYYELSLYAPPAQLDTVYYQVTRLNTGHQASGVLNAATPGTQLPASTTLLTGLNAWRTNNTTALAVGLDLGSFYIETDF